MLHHTLELCVKEFLDAPDISEVLKKTKGTSTYYHRSANRLADLHAIQKNEGLPETQPPVTGNSVRWHSLPMLLYSQPITPPLPVTTPTG